MLKEVVFISMPVNDLETLIIDCVNVCLRNGPKEPPPVTNDKDPDGLLTKQEAANLLSCSTSTIDNYARAGKLPRNYLGRNVKFRRSDVLSILSQKKEG